MKTSLHVSLAALSAANALLATAAPLELRIDPDGFVGFPGGGIRVCAFFPGWATAMVKPDFVAAEEDAAKIIGAEAGKPFAVVRRSDGGVVFKGRVRWTAQEDGTVLGVVRTVAQENVTMQCLALEAEFPAPPESGLGSGRASKYRIPCNGRRTLLLSFPEERGWYAQDSRPWGGGWAVRFGDNRRTQTFAAGEVTEWRFTISDPSGAPLALTEGHPVTIRAGDRWARLDWHKDVEPGSALDFSGLCLQDAPAGKHGWLKAVGGHFEFERLPGVEQRFYGVNLCFTANYPDHELADILVERFVRCGYNSVRIHHHDGAWAKAHDRLDYLLARFYAAGIYVTTDLFVSRPVPLRDIGEERDGNVPGDLYKTLVGCHDGAFADWCRWAQAFLEHVNPYTGRSAKDEPGIPLISLINEGALAMGFGTAGKADNPHVLAAWREFGGGDAPPSQSDATSFNRFDTWLGRRIYERCSAFVRSLGCHALLTNDNNGNLHGEGEGNTPLYDYVDSHFYVDHPQFIKESWHLPSRSLNLNPIALDSPSLLHRGYAKGASKPYAISEWNFCGPSRYRGVGGILTGAMAAEQEWDGLWRFTYSHSTNNFADGKGGISYFDAATDPIVSASDRAAVCLYLRGDAAQVEAHAVEKLKVEKLKGPGFAPGASAPLILDKERGAMAIITPRTCGGFAEEGRVEAGPLRFEIFSSPISSVTPSSVLGESNAYVPTTLWASALDGQPLATSSRILLVHLTDVQGDGTRYADESRQILEQWGDGPIIESGAADVELRLDKRTVSPAPYGDSAGRGGAAPTVFALDTAGRRVAEIPATFEDGTLRFRVSTVASDGTGRIFYEISTSTPNKGAEEQ